MRFAHAFSVVLATLSFLATRAFESFGVEHFYEYQARNFKKESGYFDVQHPDYFDLRKASYGINHFVQFDSTHWLFKPECCLKGLVFQSLDSSKSENIIPLPETQAIVDFIAVDTLLFLIDSEMGIYQSCYPFDSLSTLQVSKNKPSWESSACCYHKPTKRLIFCAPEEDGEGRLRSLYYFNISKQRYHENPIFTFDADVVLQFLEDKECRIASAPHRRFYPKELADVLPTAIAVHPKTNDFFMLSSKDRILMVFSSFGELLDASYLEEHAYSNPIDLHFNELGDLFIANPGKEALSLVKLPWNRLWQFKAGAEEVTLVN